MISSKRDMNKYSDMVNTTYEEDNMTEKELSYVEDAIGHEQNIIKICNEVVNIMQDETLKAFIQKEVDKHAKIKNYLMHMLEVKANE